jgi:hypothetical protein
MLLQWEIFHEQEPHDGEDLMQVGIDIRDKGIIPPLSNDEQVLPTEFRNLIEICT